MSVNTDGHAELRLIAEVAARAGGDVALRMFRRSLDVRLKDDGSEVSTADHAAQAAVIACLERARPQDAIVAEETIPQRDGGGAGHPGDSHGGDARFPTGTPARAVHWIIDPIDGTRNYLRGMPLFCCSVAAMIDGVPVAGAIYDPSSDVLYSAHAAGGATANGQSCIVRRAASRMPLLVAVPSKQRRIGTCDTWPREVVVRGLGTTALQLALVAAGQLDASYANDGKLWDIAAGYVLVKEAGGEITLPDGGPLFPVNPATYVREELPTLAATAELHARLLIREP